MSTFSHPSFSILCLLMSNVKGINRNNCRLLFFMSFQLFMEFKDQKRRLCSFRFILAQMSYSCCILSSTSLYLFFVVSQQMARDVRGDRKKQQCPHQKDGVFQASRLQRPSCQWFLRLGFIFHYCFRWWFVSPHQQPFSPPFHHCCMYQETTKFTPLKHLKSL